MYAPDPMEPRAEHDPVPATEDGAPPDTSPLTVTGYRQAVYVVMLDHGDDGHDVSDQVRPDVDYKIGDRLALGWDGRPRLFTVRRTDRREQIADDGTLSREWIVGVSGVAVL